MKEMILRITDSSEDIEILFNNTYNNEQKEKKLSLNKLQDAINDFVNKDSSNSYTQKISCKLVEPNIIGQGTKGSYSRYIVKQPEHQRFITLSFAKVDKAYKVNFPSSIYSVVVLNDKITEINAYMYLEDKGMETELYQYAMPNMLTQDRVCIGSANKSVEAGVIQALENIIYAPYSHEALNNIKGFSNTITYFEFLANNHMDSKYLYPEEVKLKDLF